MKAQEALEKLITEHATMKAALQRIERWDGEFPAAESEGKPCSYRFAYGSNGERDFMREIAREALNRIEGRLT